MLNSINIMGRLVKNPDLRTTANGTAVCTIRIACDRDFDRSKADFVDVVTWRQTAEFVNRNFKKGDLLIASGRLQIREWTDSDGNKKQTTEVAAESVYFGQSKKSGEDEAKAAFTETDDEDGDLPF